MEGAPKFLVLRDQRGEHRYLRASWHPESRSIVLSHWSADVCTASSRLALADVPKLVSFVVGALHDAATVPAEAPVAAGPAASMATVAGPGMTPPARAGWPTPVATAVAAWVRTKLGRTPPATAPVAAPVVPLREAPTVVAPPPSRAATGPS